MKLLIIGSNGQLGSDFVKLSESDPRHSVVPVDCPQIDIRDKSSVESVVNGYAPDAIVNCAAFTAVDDCETNGEAAFALNARACENLALAAKARSAPLIHISTDYVFDGAAASPYTEDCPTNPQTVYGKSKLRGEEIITDIYGGGSMLFRIAWLYGANGANFVKTVRRAALSCRRENKPLRVVNDQFGTPTWTVSVCRQILSVIDRGERGVFHATCEGACTWFDFAKEIVAACGTGAEVLPCTTEEFPRPAPRPRYSVLENARLKAMGANIMPGWREAFSEFLSTERADI
jgi:dTDP-4-dehydrorhamnose reductase